MKGEGVTLMNRTINKMLVGVMLLTIFLSIYLQSINKDYKAVQASVGIVESEVSEKLSCIENPEEEAMRVKLYIAVMKDAFNIANGGNDFIAIKKDTLKGLSEKSKEEVRQGLEVLSPKVYWFEDIKDNKTFFIINEKKNNQISATINGTLLYLDLREFKGNEAIVETTSWYGNLGAVIPTYKALYKNGQWELKNIGTGVS